MMFHATVLCSVLNCQSLRMHKQRLLFEHRISVGYPGTRRVMGSYYPVPILGTGENTSGNDYRETQVGLR